MMKSACEEGVSLVRSRIEELERACICVCIHR